MAACDSFVCTCPKAVAAKIHIHATMGVISLLLCLIDEESATDVSLERRHPDVGRLDASVLAPGDSVSHDLPNERPHRLEAACQFSRTFIGLADASCVG
jgi:hypothetical protein